MGFSTWAVAWRRRSLNSSSWSPASFWRSSSAVRSFSSAYFITAAPVGFRATNRVAMGSFMAASRMASFASVSEIPSIS